MTSLGAYELGERIAVGGMAEIFRARHEEGGRDVVVKRLLPQYARDPEVVAMLAHEGRLMQRLAHPALVRVMEVSAESETPFLVLEHVDGLPLSDLMDEAVSPAMALAVVRPVLEALGHVHSARDEDGTPLDVVHRDVTPHNVLVDREGRVRLGDFGIARSSLRGARTRTGMIKGKLRYLAPEQVTGSAVDKRTDLYAVGLMLFELVAGEPFLSADSEPALIRLAEAPTQRSCGDAAVDRVLERALSRFPETRPRSAEAFLRALEKNIPEPPDPKGWASRVEAAVAQRVPAAVPVAVPPEDPALHSPLSPSPIVQATLAAPPKKGRTWLGVALGIMMATVLGVLALGRSDPPGPPSIAAPVTAEPTTPEPAEVSVTLPTPDPEPVAADPVLADPPEEEPAPIRRSRRARSGPAEPASAAPASADPATPSSTAEPATAPVVDPNEAAREAALVSLNRIDAGLRRRGIRPTDLAAESRAALTEARREARSGTPDLEALSRLEASLAELAVDESFVRLKLQRVDARIRAARNEGQDVAEIERRSALALQSLLEHRPAQTNAHLNAILDRL